VSRPECDGDPLGKQATGHERERPGRRAVKPLGVIDHAEQRLLFGCLAEESEDREPDKKGVRRLSGFEPEGDAERIVLRSRQALDELEQRGAEPLHRRVVKLHLPLDACGAYHSKILTRLDRVLEQCGLADAGLAVQNQHGMATVPRGIQQPLEHRALASPSNQPLSRDRRDHPGSMPLGQGLRVSGIRSPSGSGHDPSMNNTTLDPRIATVREFVARVFNGHEPELVREYMTPDVVWHGNTVGEVNGADTLVAVLTGFIGALPDIHAEEQDIIASGDLVVLRQVVSATQSGDLLGIPASGKPVTWNAVDIYRVGEDGKITEQWAFEDMAAIGSQLGAFALPWAR